MRRQERSSAELESKKIVLSKQKDILNKAFNESLASLESSKPATKKKYYAKMVDAAQSFIAEPKAYCAVGEKANLKGLKVSSVVEDEDIGGGLILENEDGSVLIDMQFRTILSGIWDKELKSLSDILFG
jgi:V/A-type H+-transporting ATPase subunit E